MAQTFVRVNKTRKNAEVADLRRDILSKQNKNLSKHRNYVYDLIESYDDIDDDLGDDCDGNEHD